MIFQKGVGLIEVLVALLLLGVGVLGYAALYLRAMEASSEALVRSQAIVISRSLTESIRVNPEGQFDYPTEVQRYTTLTQRPVATRVCVNASTSCTAKEVAAYDAFLAADSAFTIGMRLTMTECPGTDDAVNPRNCIFVAWGGTTLTPTDYSRCMSEAGVYVTRANCLMMEAY